MPSLDYIIRFMVKFRKTEKRILREMNANFDGPDEDAINLERQISQLEDQVSYDKPFPN